MFRLIPFITLLALFFTTPALAGKLEARVLNVLSGDEIEITANGNRRYIVRLQAIEAPEKKQPGARISQKHLAMLIVGQPVTVEFNNMDGRGALIGVVRHGGRDINLRQVTDGMVRVEERLLNNENKTSYIAAELKARQQNLGIWGLKGQKQ